MLSYAPAGFYHFLRSLLFALKGSPTPYPKLWAHPLLSAGAYSMYASCSGVILFAYDQMKEKGLVRHVVRIEESTDVVWREGQRGSPRLRWVGSIKMGLR